MEVNSSKSATSIDERTRRNYAMMVPCLKRTCLSAESALTGRPNVEDVPLCAKLPMIPGNKLLLYTTNLCEKLHRPSCDFDRTYPSDVYVSNEYRCLHDPHLRSFFLDRPAMRRRLRKNNYITPEQKVICSLREYNLYRQYLKHLSIEYLNKKYLEQYEKERQKNKEEAARTIEEKKNDVDNPITVRIEKARKIRMAIEKELEGKKREVLRESQIYKERRAREKREERMLRILNEEMRERERENKNIRRQQRNRKHMYEGGTVGLET
uniref:fibrous sheath-interacting protein 2-like isoform X1 n=1 Tax=Styela clava TaxID=7725 RepID=UPI0019398784|nr:fibrous sheath-interacting protein 2-like isoform X1 [Styela clava]